MNWWVVIQLSYRLTQLNQPPDSYLVSDRAFFAQTSVNQPIDLERPDTLLLDVALFQATNEARRNAGLAILQYDQALYQAAKSHAESMIYYEYVSHEDFYQLSEMSLLNRVRKRTDRFGRIAENIGQYQTIATAEWYGVRFNARRQQYEYVNSANQHPYGPYSYAQYARYAVQQWLNSPHHRANLLNAEFTFVGCAGRLSRNPFHQRQSPFGRLVQDFGVPRIMTQSSR